MHRYLSDCGLTQVVAPGSTRTEKPDFSRANPDFYRRVIATDLDSEADHDLN